MERNQAEQIARIIYNVFEHEEQIDPRTIALMFQYMGRIGCSENLNESVSYYHCGNCTEDSCITMECPCCGYQGEQEDVCQHESQTPHAKSNIHMCVKCLEEYCR